VWANRLKESIAMMSIGDGMLALIAPRNHVALWLLGPKRLRRLTLWFAENPTYTRIGGIAEVGLGTWLALRQYQQEAAPQPWYQRWFAQYRLLPGWLAPLMLFLAIVLAAGVFRRTTTRGKTPSEEDQSREELAVEDAVVEESRKAIRSIIRESVERSRRQQ
jgi:hypothetical protein